MKKTLAYLTTGIMLGIVLILLPATLSPEETLGWSRWTTMGREPFFAPPLEGETYKGLSGIEQPKEIEIGGIDGIGVFPSSLLYVGLMSVISLLFALGVYAFFKRRMIT